MSSVKIKAVSAEAMQWTPNNRREVLAWLANNEIVYSFHELTSGGQLIVYEEKGGPIQIWSYHWIIKFNNKKILRYTPEEFADMFEVVDENTENI